MSTLTPRRRALRLLLALLLPSALTACRFSFDRPLSPGQLSGQAELALSAEQRAPAAGARVLLDGAPLFALANDDGRFALRGLPPGNHTIRVTWSDTAGVEQAAVRLRGIELQAYTGGAAIDLGRIEVGGLGALRGLVQVDGLPVETATIVIGGVGIAAVTAGGFSVPMLPAGTYDVAAVTADGVTPPVSVTVSARQESQLTIDVPRAALQTAGALSGVVVPVGGATLRGATVRLAGSDVPPLSLDAQGRFSSGPIKAGVYALAASGPETEVSQLGGVLVVGDTALETTLLLLPGTPDCNKAIENAPAGDADADGTLDANEPLVCRCRPEGVEDRDEDGICDSIRPPVAAEDSTPRPAPAIVGVIPDSGAPGDGITNGEALQLTGTAAARTTVEISLTGIDATRSAIAGDDAQWSVDLPVLPEGTYAVSATTRDGSDLFTLVVDRTAQAPVIEPWVDDTGPVGDGRTTRRSLALQGTGEPRAHLTVADALAGSIPMTQGSVTVADDGRWTFTVNDLVAAPHELTARQVDLAGNESPLSAPLAVQVDDPRPSLRITPGTAQVVVEDTPRLLLDGREVALESPYHASVTVTVSAESGALGTYSSGAFIPLASTVFTGTAAEAAAWLRTLVYSPALDRNEGTAVLITVTNEAGSRVDSIPIEITPVADAPVILGPANIWLVQGASVAVTLSLRAPDSDLGTLQVTASPAVAVVTPPDQPAVTMIALPCVDGITDPCLLGTTFTLTAPAEWPQDLPENDWLFDLTPEGGTAFRMQVQLRRDSDGDGISDEWERGAFGATPGDVDGDSLTDGVHDSDTDDDGREDGDEWGGTSTPRDSDLDGTPDVSDLDSDNDGIPDAQEGDGDDDRDNKPDWRDDDQDGDGVLDSTDNCRSVSNPTQADTTEASAGAAADGVGDACDICPTVSENGNLPVCDWTLGQPTLPSNLWRDGTALLAPLGEPIRVMISDAPEADAASFTFETLGPVPVRAVEIAATACATTFEGGGGGTIVLPDPESGDGGVIVGGDVRPGDGGELGGGNFSNVQPTAPAGTRCFGFTPGSSGTVRIRAGTRGVPQQTRELTIQVLQEGATEENVVFFQPDDATPIADADGSFDKPLQQPLAYLQQQLADTLPANLRSGRQLYLRQGRYSALPDHTVLSLNTGFDRTGLDQRIVISGGWGAGADDNRVITGDEEYTKLQSINSLSIANADLLLDGMMLQTSQGIACSGNAAAPSALRILGSALSANGTTTLTSTGCELLVANSMIYATSNDPAESVVRVEPATYAPHWRIVHSLLSQKGTRGGVVRTGEKLAGRMLGNILYSKSPDPVGTAALFDANVLQLVPADSSLATSLAEVTLPLENHARLAAQDSIVAADCAPWLDVAPMGTEMGGTPMPSHCRVHTQLPEARADDAGGARLDSAADRLALRHDRFGRVRWSLGHQPGPDEPVDLDGDNPPGTTDAQDDCPLWTNTSTRQGVCPTPDFLPSNNSATHAIAGAPLALWVQLPADATSDRYRFELGQGRGFALDWSHDAGASPLALPGNEQPRVVTLTSTEGPAVVGDTGVVARFVDVEHPEAYVQGIAHTDVLPNLVGGATQYFVDLGATENGNGSEAQPFNRWPVELLANASAGAPVHLLVAESSAVEGAVLPSTGWLPPHVRVYGGYTRATDTGWHRRPALAETTLAASNATALPLTIDYVTPYEMPVEARLLDGVTLLPRAGSAEAPRGENEPTLQIQGRVTIARSRLVQPADSGAAVQTVDTTQGVRIVLSGNRVEGSASGANASPLVQMSYATLPGVYFNDLLRSIAPDDAGVIGAAFEVRGSATYYEGESGSAAWAGNRFDVTGDDGSIGGLYPLFRVTDTTMAFAPAAVFANAVNGAGASPLAIADNSGEGLQSLDWDYLQSADILHAGLGGQSNIGSSASPLVCSPEGDVAGQPQWSASSLQCGGSGHDSITRLRADGDSYQWSPALEWDRFGQRRSLTATCIGALCKPATSVNVE